MLWKRSKSIWVSLSWVAMLTSTWTHADLAVRLHKLRLSQLTPPAESKEFARKLQGETLTVEYEVSAAGGLIPLGQIHDWVFRVTDRKGKPVTGVRLTVTPIMVQHSHGMTTRPK